MQLTHRDPHADAAALIARFTPPGRFADVRFDTYAPNDEHPSQRAALDALRSFSAESAPASASGPRRLFKRSSRSDAVAARPARYLDGGFGVGKTHLLASLWHEGPHPKAFLTFAELTAVIGFLGMSKAVDAFGSFRLVCIDEFELDDVANTLMAVTFLRSIIGDTKVAATSNTLPDKLGEGRFAAEDFRREIAAIADHFEVLRIDGPDYRAKDRVEAEPMSDVELEQFVSTHLDAGRAVSRDRFDALLPHLRAVHPVQVAGLLDGLDAVAIDQLAPISNQGDALLFVHLVDELYDADIAVAATGCRIEELFPASYRSGGYRKKYGRCESRLLSMLGDTSS